MSRWHNRDKENVIDRDEFPYITDKDYFCKKCGKSKYSEFTYIGTPVGMSGWSEDKVCPTCGAKVEINHPDTMGGCCLNAVYYLKEFIDPIDTNKY